MKRRGKFRTEFRRDGKLVYSIRNPDGTFANIEDTARAARAERRVRAKKIVRSGLGWRGETKPKKRR